MDNKAKIILNLIRKAIDANFVIYHRLMTRANWRKVMASCSSQGVLGICFDAFERMEEASRPPNTLLLEWYGQVHLHANLYKKQDRLRLA